MINNIYKKVIYNRLFHFAHMSFDCLVFIDKTQKQSPHIFFERLGISLSFFQNISFGSFVIDGQATHTAALFLASSIIFSSDVIKFFTPINSGAIPLSLICLIFSFIILVLKSCAIRYISVV